MWMTDLFQAGRLLAAGIEGKFTRERGRRKSACPKRQKTLWFFLVQVRLQEQGVCWEAFYLSTKNAEFLELVWFEESSEN